MHNQPSFVLGWLHEDHAGKVAHQLMDDIDRHLAVARRVSIDIERATEGNELAYLRERVAELEAELAGD